MVKTEFVSAEDKRQKRVASIDNTEDFMKYLEEEPKKRKTQRIQTKIDAQLDRAYEKSEKKHSKISDEEYDLPQIHKIPESKHQQKHEIVKAGMIPDLVKPKDSNEAGRVIQNQVARPPMDESGDVDLNKLFSSEMGNESDVVKELFSSENIKVKTDLTINEIKIISRLELQASMTQNFFLAKILKEYETLLVSKDRKSRGEFVNSFRGIGDNNSGATAFSKIGNIFNKDKV